MDYEIFNGDADGICALHQMRLADPRPGARLVTGVKRDIRLLARIAGQVGEGDRLRVFDISLDSNREPLAAILATGAEVWYADHHYAGEIPAGNITTHIDPAPEICTSLIVDRLLKGRYRAWAVAAAFGDNLHDSARAAAAAIGLGDQETAALRELGELLNYNGYGGEVADLHFAPDALYRALAPYEDPFAFIKESEDLARLRRGFAADMEQAAAQEAVAANATGRIYRFPAAAWSKRVAGVFSNERARERPGLAHALLVDNGDGTLMVSVRAPLARRQGADTLCRAFPTGGGRAAAAGINALPADQVEAFVDRFMEVFS